MAVMDRLLKVLVSLLTWGFGVVFPALLLVSGRRAVAVAVLSLFAVLLLIGWRWRAFLWWAIAGMSSGITLGFASGWFLVFAGGKEVDDQSAVIFLLTIPLGIAAGLVLAGGAFRRWDPRSK